MSAFRRTLAVLSLCAALAGLNGCATTIGNIGLGAGLGVAATVSALYCVLACSHY
ncbi:MULTISPECIES: hypothetical protein [Paraburkholderia]|jgi:hypothetical protein|uniref:Uncharacterized protein n=1 Tax=Paraburkholderia tropica TaxID=92647 RepID=A0AAQ1GCG5_9BURK|nr:MULTISPECIES: hypothetical protein [Paraburkholderia]MBB2983199.1 hypothetical protein [Paraburkholderia tropica]MBB3004147.1 hypothetical protein [Paraburkholderia tropica]MBB6323116.1 hypothetical protein [Paraburkholderia tropica]MDE1144340.1 hypothetical protein [Paraburkholderia tropica]PXX08294.1 hypothetical protein C7400_12768 [Paraburkholderia tropica]